MSEARPKAVMPMALPHIFTLPKPVIGAAYLAGYVALDWISFIQPFAPFGITPWNPSPGLSFILVLLFGQRFLPLLFVAPLMADLLVRHLPLSIGIEFLTSLLIGAIYSLALNFLLSPRLRFGAALSSSRDLMLLLSVAGVSAAFVAVSYVGILMLGGYLVPADFPAAAMRYWVGDVIGIAVLAPAGLIALTRGTTVKISFETGFQVLAIVASLVLVFMDIESHQLQLFYILFLPVFWIAARAGLEGATVGILVTQLGLIFGFQYLSLDHVNLTAFQAVMIVLAITGLAAGTLVTERRKAESQLHLHQDSLANLARIGSMGQLAAAIAHEINQPLMAAGTYTRLVSASLHDQIGPNRSIAETAEKAAAQVQRAADVVRHLRALIRLDKSDRAPIQIERIVKEALAICQPDLERTHIATSLSIPAGLPAVIADMLQIEQVVLNLVRNAIDAIEKQDDPVRRIEIAARALDGDFVEISVCDSGPGFDPALLESPPLPFVSAKDGGLGIGLSLCRSIVESHQGTLRLATDERGARVAFTLPTEHGTLR